MIRNITITIPALDNAKVTVATLGAGPPGRDGIDATTIYGNPVALDKGGTGSTTDVDARDALSVYAKAETDTLVGDEASVRTVDDLFPLRQNASRRGGSVYTARVASEFHPDVYMGDSIGLGAGASALGSTAWPYVAAKLEARKIDSPGAARLKLCNEDDSVYGSNKWANLAQGAAGTTGPSAGVGAPPATSWVLSANGQTVGDTDTFRVLEIIFERQSSGGGTFQYSTDGGTTYNGTDISTAGSGLASVKSADLGTASSRTFTVKQTSTGDTVRLHGARYHQTPDAASGIGADVVAHGGTTTADWLANRGWETWLTWATPRRVTISLGGNDMRNGVDPTTAFANLATILARARQAAPLAEIVLVIPYFFGESTDTHTLSAFLSTWVPGWKAAAQTAGATVRNLYDRFGDCSHIAPNADPFGMTMDGGLHFGDAGQFAHAEHALEELSTSKAYPPAPSTVYAPIIAPRITTSLTLVDLAGGGNVVVIDAGSNSPGIQIRADETFNNPAVAIGVVAGVFTGVYAGDATTDTPVDTTLLRTGVGVWSASPFAGLAARGSFTLTGLTSGGSVTMADVSSHVQIGVRNTSGHTNADAVFGIVSGASGLAFGDIANDSAPDWKLLYNATASAKVTGTLVVSDLFTLQDDGDATKQVKFQLSGLTTGNTRTLTVPDASGTLTLSSDLSAYAPKAAPTLTSNVTIWDGTAAHGQWVIGTGNVGFNIQLIQLFNQTTDSNAVASFGNVAGNISLEMGGGSGATDVKFARTGAATATLTGTFTFATGLTMADAKNIVFGTTTGTQIGTSTSQKLALWAATPIVQPTGSTDILTGLVNMGARASGANPPLNMGTGALTCGALTASGNVALGDATTDTIGLYGVAGIAQRSGAAQASVVTTTATQTTPWGYATQAQANGVITLLNELRAWAVALGGIKGSA